MARIRGRNVRARFLSLSQWAEPLKMILFVAVVIGLSYISVLQLQQLFFGTSYFELKKIEVEGLKALRRDEVVKLAGVTPSMNIFNIDRESIKSRLLLHPSICSARIVLDGLYTLKIVVEERTPLMYVKSGPSFLEVSDDGTILGSVSCAEKDLPLITGIDASDRRIGDSINNNDSFLEARSWVKTLPANLFQGISEINFASLQNPYIYLLNGVKIIPRDLPDFQNRYNFLCALLDNLRKNKVEPEYLDLRAPNEIVIKSRRTKRATEGGDHHIAGG